MNGDQSSIELFLAVIIIFAVALCLLNQLFVHPWLLIPVAGAVLCYYLAKRAKRRERGEK